MVRISAIKETKRGTFALFDESGFLFSVDDETLSAGGLHTGAELSEAELDELQRRSDTRRACDAALRWLSRRAYAERELYEKLCIRHDEHSAAAAVARMCEAGLLNDTDFALAKAESLAEKGKSPREISHRLAALGIDGDTARRALDVLEVDGAQSALAVVRKYYVEKLRDGQREKVMAALARRGFSHGEITAALALAGEEMAL